MYRTLLTIAAFATASLIFIVQPSLALYTQPTSVVSSGGGLSASANYENLSVIGQPVAGVSTSTGYTNQSGFLYTLVGQGALPQFATLYLLFDQAGTGSGTLAQPTLGLSCGSNCSSSQMLTGTQYTVSASPGQYALLYSLTGPNCSAGNCTFTPTGDVTVTARFDRDTAHQVYVPNGGGGGTYYSSLQVAYDAALPGSTVMTWAQVYAESLTCGIDKAVTLKGGFNQGYTSVSGWTTLNGILTFGRGGVTMEEFAVK